MLQNDEGADFLPVRLAAVLIVASLVLVSAACYAGGMAGQRSKAAARDCVSRIVAIASAEYAESCPGLGDGAFIDVSVPSSVSSIIFGPLPAGGTANATGACSIQYADGSCELYLPGLPLGSGGPGRGGPLVLHPGNYRMRISTEEVNGRPMALLYAEGT